MDAYLKTELQEMDPYEFEHFIAELWELQGWETTVSNQSVDRGVDIGATRKDGGFATTAVVQAKRYQAGNKVGSKEIQQYGSLRRQEDTDLAIVVTTSTYTRQARKLASDLNVKLIDGHQLVELIENNEAYNLLLKYTESPETATPHQEIFPHTNQNEERNEDKPFRDIKSLKEIIHPLNDYQNSVVEREFYETPIPVTIWTYLIPITMACCLFAISGMAISPEGTQTYFLSGSIYLLSNLGLVASLFIDPHTVFRYSDWRPHPFYFAGLALIPYLNLVIGTYFIYRRRRESTQAASQVASDTETG